MKRESPTPFFGCQPSHSFEISEADLSENPTGQIRKFVFYEHSKLRDAERYYVVYREKSIEPLITLLLGMDRFAASAYKTRHYFEYEVTSSILEPCQIGLVDSSNNRSIFLPHFTDLFTIMLDHFKGLQVPISGVRGIWWNSIVEEGYTNTNYDVLKKLIRAAMPIQMAALHTPTGKSAKTHGFGKVQIIRDNEEGVEVLFSK